jgi:hypothetical protein
MDNKISGIDDILYMADHAYCIACGNTFGIRDSLGWDIDTRPATVEDFEQANCPFGCADSLIEPVIISETPLFPPDKPDSEANEEHWHYGLERYTYNLNDNLLDMIDRG